MSDMLTRPGFIWQFPATIDRVIDGDTIVCHVLWKPGDEAHGVDVRVDGINAIELSQAFGKEAKVYAETLLDADVLSSEFTSGLPVTLVARKKEKYGRFLARIVLGDGRDFGQEMLVARASDGVTPLAVPYNP